MTRELKGRFGRVTLSDDVLATIAGAAATECYGIVGMASRKLKDGIAELLGRESLSRGVEIADDGGLVIRLYIVAGYGTRISEVASNAMDRVRYAVETMTGLPVRRVDVRVQGVRLGGGRRD